MADTGSQAGDVGDPGSSHEDEMLVEETGEARSLSPTEEETAPVNSGSGQNVSDDESLGLSIQEVSLHDPTGAAEDMEGIQDAGEDEVAASGIAVAKESEEVDNTARRSPPHSLTSGAGSASEAEEEDVLTEVHSESSEVSTKDAPDTGRRAREKRRAHKKRAKRAPPCERKPTDQEIRDFMADARTQESLYPGLFTRGNPPQEVEYLPDEKTGLPQHSYVYDPLQRYGAAERVHWAGVGKKDKRPADEKPELRWGMVSKRAANLGHNQYPQLVPGVSVRVTNLPKDTINRRTVQALYAAWIQAGCRCPVEGCEPWAALDAPAGCLPQPQALLARQGSRMQREYSDCSKFDASLLCSEPTPWFKEHGWKNLDGIVEHWAHFHMRRGRCFVAPCCSKKPVTEKHGCHNAAFNSVNTAVDHLVQSHHDEVKAKQTALRKARDARKGKSVWDELKDVDLNDERSVAQQLVAEMMETFQQKIGIPRVVGRKRWFQNVNL